MCHFACAFFLKPLLFNTLAQITVDKIASS